MRRALAFLFVCWLLAACGGEVAPTVTAIPAPTATAVVIVVTATAPPATATNVAPTATAVPPTEAAVPPTETPVPPSATPTGLAGVLGKYNDVQSIESSPAQVVVSFRPAQGWDDDSTVHSIRYTVWMYLQDLHAHPEVRFPVVEFVALVDMLDFHGNPLPNTPEVRMWFKEEEVRATRWENLVSSAVADHAYKLYIHPVLQKAWYGR